MEYSDVGEQKINSFKILNNTSLILKYMTFLYPLSSPNNNNNKICNITILKNKKAIKFTCHFLSITEEKTKECQINILQSEHTMQNLMCAK